MAIGYSWCICGHTEKKHDNAGKCLAGPFEESVRSTYSPCRCKGFEKDTTKTETYVG